MTLADIFDVSSVRKRAVLFFQDCKRIFSASVVSGILMSITLICAGLYPMLGLFLFSKFSDAFIGARGLGVMTGEVNAYLWMMIAYFFGGILLHAAYAKFTGVAARIVRDGAEVLLLLSLVVCLFTVMPVISLILLFGSLIVSVISKFWLRFFAALLLCVVSVGAILNIVDLSVHRAATVGQAFLFGGALFFFICISLLLGWHGKR